MCALAACGCGSSRPAGFPARTSAHPPSTTSTYLAGPRPAPKLQAPFAIGLRVIRLVDHSRLIRIPGRPPQPRTLVTVIRYPATGPPARVDARGAAPVRGSGPFPLVVFGHGYTVTPAPYAPLLRAWTRAGYIVAAPIFPLENANAPGGPDEADLINQPRDMSFVITRTLAMAQARSGFLAGLVDPRRIAVAGHSDGGETALAVAYDRYFRDRRVRAAVILSGAEIPSVGGFDFPRPSPPLLATQGTADPVNPPNLTSAFYDAAPPPKYLLTLFGASHIGPYSDQQPQLGIVERVTIAFLDQYLKDAPGAAGRITDLGDVSGTSLVTSAR
ncbi:MAG: hypothetical protein JO372_16985 [Solirubrobacterales bacterium]|nr:hypothetical protein [Solirubrobacterales bacterium]